MDWCFSCHQIKALVVIDVVMEDAAAEVTVVVVGAAEVAGVVMTQGAEGEEEGDEVEEEMAGKYPYIIH